MTTVVAKWGNSLAIRIPRSVAEQAQVTEGIAINFSVEGNRIVITPQKRKKYTCGLTDNINPVLAYFKALPC